MISSYNIFSCFFHKSFLNYCWSFWRTRIQTSTICHFMSILVLFWSTGDLTATFLFFNASFILSFFSWNSIRWSSTIYNILHNIISHLLLHLEIFYFLNFLLFCQIWTIFKIIFKIDMFELIWRQLIWKEILLFRNDGSPLLMSICYWCLLNLSNLFILCYLKEILSTGIWNSRITDCSNWSIFLFLNVSLIQCILFLWSS